MTGEVIAQPEKFLVSGKPDQQGSIGNLPFHHQFHARREFQSFQLTQRRWIAISHAEDRRRFPGWPFEQRHTVREGSAAVLAGNQVPVRIDLRISQQSRHSILEALGNKMLQALCFFVNFVPGIFEDVVEKQFQQAMVPYDLPCPPLARRTQARAVMLLIQHQRRPLGG